MTFFETPQRHGGFAEAPPSTMGELWNAAVGNADYVDNTNARKVSRLEAFDQRIDAIFKATGVRLENPEIGHGYTRDWLAKRARGEVGPVFDRYELFRERLDELREQFPDHADLIGSGMEPIEAARRKARAMDRGLREAGARYRGLPGTQTLTEFAGAMYGGLHDPLNIASMMIGPWRAATAGIKGLLWMGVKQGAANAAVEAAFQPMIASWRKEAGLGYDVSHFAMNVAAAGAFGFAADAGFRGAARGINRARGRVPVLDERGGITGWEMPDDALERAAAKSGDATVRAAAGGDVAAMRRLADETGLTNDPELRAGFEAAADFEAADRGRPAGVDINEFDDRLLQAVRHAEDPREPRPLAPEPVYRAPEGTVEPPEVLAARRRLNEEALSAVEAADLIRRVPQALDQSVSLASKVMRDARNLARLSDEAFARITRGDGDPEIGAMVGMLVADKASHARVLDAVMAARPENAAEARQAIAAHAAPERAVEADGFTGGIGDVAGEDGRRQVEALRERYREDIEHVRQVDRAPRIDDDVEGLSLAGNLALADRFTHLAELMEACKP